MKTVNLGSRGLACSQIGPGCLGMNAFNAGRPEEESLATLRLALEMGVAMFDSAVMYGPFRNEILLAKVLGADRGKVRIATKIDDNGKVLAPNGSPAYARETLERSLRYLDTDCIDLYYLHRTYPKTAVE